MCHQDLRERNLDERCPEAILVEVTFVQILKGQLGVGQPDKRDGKGEKAHQAERGMCKVMEAEENVVSLGNGKSMTS